MNGILQDLRYAARMLRSNPGFSAVAVLALGIGIGADTAVFTVVNGVLLRPLPFPEPDRLMLIAATPRGGNSAPTRLSDRDFLAFRQADRLFDALATFDSRGADLAGAGEPVHLPAAAVTPGFFRAFAVIATAGRPFAPDEEGSPVAIIAGSLWRERFGSDPAIIGRTVRVDGIARTIIGVMPPGFRFPEDAEIWTPLAVRADQRPVFLRPVVGRLRPGVSRAQAQAELQSILGSARVAAVQPFRELMVGEVRRPLLIFDGAVGFVLLIACANVANLLLIRTASRRQEMAIRGAIGASAGRLVRQLLTESALLAAIGGTAGLLLAMWGVPTLLALAPEGAIPRADEVHIDGWVLAFTAGVSLLTGILFGLAPLPHAVRTPLRAGTYRRTRLRKVLAVAELALALVLLAGGGLMVKSFHRLRAVDSGYRPENVLTLTVSLPEAVYSTPLARLEFQQKLLEKLEAVPGVAAAGAVDLAPLGSQFLAGDIKVENGAPIPGGYLVERSCASPGYFRAMGIGLLRGRDFTPRDDAAAPRVAVVSQSVARHAWPGRDPIGQRISVAPRPSPHDWLTVVGVVDDVRQFGPAEGPAAGVYRPLAQAVGQTFGTEMTFVARTAIDPALIAPTILRRAVYDVDRTQAIASIATMQDRLARSVAERVFQTRVLAAFAILALLMAAVGIYGVLAYSVAERTREIGIRIALGAAPRAIMGEVLRGAAMLAVIGIALGTAGAFAATRALSGLLFEVKPGDPAVFAAVAALLGGVAVVAGWAPARRATRVDPVVALRYE